ncbi:MAG: complex I NDUFA9 subunit family protein [Leptospirales bacterium]
MNAVLTGGTGFIGKAILEQWSGEGDDGWIRCVSRKPPVRALPQGATWFRGTVSEPGSLARSFEGADVLVHLAGILAETENQTYENVHVEGTRNVLLAARAAGIRRILYLSAIGASADAASRYHRTKFAAEELLKGSGMDITIFRPSVVFGPGDRFLSLFVSMARRIRVLPLIGNGTSRIHPVFVRDLARSILSSLVGSGSSGRTFGIGGPRIYRYRELMTAIAVSLNIRAWVLPQPVGLLNVVAGLQEALLPAPFLTREMILMAQEDNVAEPNDLVTYFKVSPFPLEAYLESDPVVK